MNEKELSDLEFLLTVSPEVLADWYSKMPKEEIDYAADLMQRAYDEGAMRLDDVKMKDLSQAKNILSKYTL